ncbi:pyridoxal phosphate-dependent aminotransferase, partial [candidate division KSB1 bacterium]
RLIVLTNLHNPTQAVLDEERVREIVRIGREAGACVALDEVFLPMLETDFRKHGFSAGAISTNSLGKCWGLDALRVGWSIGPQEIIHRAYRLNNLLGVNQPYMTEDLAWRILNAPAAVKYLLKYRKQAANGRELFDRFLEKTPSVTCMPPAAGICALVQLPAGTDDRIFCERLLSEQDTAVFPGHFFECPGAIRVCFGGPQDEVAEGLKRLSSMVRSLT